LPLVTSGTCAWMREMHAQKRFWCRCSQRKREAGEAIEPVWNRRDCISGAVKYQSFWTLSANPLLLSHKTMTALASSHQRTPAQILFRYLTQIGVVPLTGTKSDIHMREDLAIFDFELTIEERGAIDALL
jgi:hypothetical protein